MSGIEFEDLLQDLFKKLGHLVVKTPVSGDQGADLIIKKGGEKIAVQAKRYSKPVTNKAIQEAVAATKHYKCDRAMVITTSKFTKSARQLASSNNVELWDGNKLNKVLKDIITH
ncbi:restriction endonuclease [Candidatus Woesebacteria bacterium]|nr:restriction endonuclease [Candidatus Woesebacteria bacterium]